MAKLMYGGGLRLTECMRLRVMDLDFAKSQVYVRGKGGKDRLTTLPPSICGDLKAQLSRVKKQHKLRDSLSRITTRLRSGLQH